MAPHVLCFMGDSMKNYGTLSFLSSSSPFSYLSENPILDVVQFIFPPKESCYCASAAPLAAAESMAENSQ